MRGNFKAIVDGRGREHGEQSRRKVERKKIIYGAAGIIRESLVREN